MKNYLKIKIALVEICIILSITSCNLHPRPMTVREFYPFENSIDSTFFENKWLFTKSDCFIISNYVENDSTDYKIDSLAKKYRDKDYENYKKYYMIFYKESKYTNEEYIKKDPRSIDRYSQQHDLRYAFSWSNGKFEGMDKFKNGELLNPSGDIRIGPVPEK